jgi:hypothetical protein
MPFLLLPLLLLLPQDLANLMFALAVCQQPVSKSFLQRCLTAFSLPLPATPTHAPQISLAGLGSTILSYACSAAVAAAAAGAGAAAGLGQPHVCPGSVAMPC